MFALSFLLTIIILKNKKILINYAYCNSEQESRIRNALLNTLIGAIDKGF